MNYKPILFSTPMVQAILHEKKTQTRRVIKPQPTNPRYNCIGWLGWEDGHGYKIQPQPHSVGDILWVRETWADGCMSGYIYKAGHEYADRLDDLKQWRPSIFMPKEACRIFLRVTDVRVERVRDISEADATSEGVKNYHDSKGNITTKNKVEAFRHLWDYLNEKRGFGWDTNPWVWVYTFERVEKPTDWLNSEGE